MNLLTEALPDYVEVCNARYPVVTSFRDWIRFFELLEDEELSETQRLQIGVLWYIDKRPEPIEEAWQALLDFALCKNIPKAGKQSSKSKKETNAEAPCFSWIYDAPYVLGAFRQAYSIDLTACDMHWYTFFALFQALPDDTPLKQRMSLRRIKTADIKDKERKKQVSRAQRAVAIPRSALTAEQIGEVFM